MTMTRAEAVAHNVEQLAAFAAGMAFKDLLTRLVDARALDDTDNEREASDV